jgi:hypothetical protein
MRKLNTKNITAIVANCLLYLVFLSGCKSDSPAVIKMKFQYDFYEKPMPPCICRFFYEEGYQFDYTQFWDSCHKYNVGDTIVGRKKN